MNCLGSDRWSNLVTRTHWNANPPPHPSTIQNLFWQLSSFALCCCCSGHNLNFKTRRWMAGSWDVVHCFHYEITESSEEVVSYFDPEMRRFLNDGSFQDSLAGNRKRTVISFTRKNEERYLILDPKTSFKLFFSLQHRRRFVHLQSFESFCTLDSWFEVCWCPCTQTVITASVTVVIWSITSLPGSIASLARVSHFPVWLHPK